jgi:hypothetical protein
MKRTFLEDVGGLSLCLSHDTVEIAIGSIATT